MMKSSVFSLFLLLGISGVSIAQNPTYVREMIDSLCAPRYHGRGYVSSGDVKAADFLVRQCAAKELKPFEAGYTQSFDLAVNTFPGEMKVSINGNELETGEDYIIQPQSPGIKGEFKAFYFNPKWIGNREKLFKLSAKEKVNASIVVIDAREENPELDAFIQRLPENPLQSKGYIVITSKKLTWSVGRRLIPAPIFTISSKAVPKKIKEVQLEIDQVWIDQYESKNVIAKIEGKSDSMIVYTAHYDHLGRMGKDTYIAGASDNASGTAMLLDLADFYLKTPPEHDVVFIWFAGEEAGLVGSRYFVDNPLIDLEKIKFLVNLDLMADAAKGITAVNGKIFIEDFDALSSVNERYQFIEEVKSRGSSANSDHYPFYEKDVPCFFIYTMGDYTHYHDIHDVPENIPLAKYSEVFRLIVMFVEERF